MKKIFIGILTVLTFGIMNGVTTVSAAEIDYNDNDVVTSVEYYDLNENYVSDIEGNVGVSTNKPYIPFDTGISTYGTSKPDKDSEWNLKTKGAYSISGDSYYHDLYSNYHFTGTTGINVTMNIEDYAYFVTVTLYKRVSILPDSKVGSFKAEAGKSTVGFFKNLDSDALYYLKFEAPCYFTGSVYSNN